MSSAPTITSAASLGAAVIGSPFSVTVTTAGDPTPAIMAAGFQPVGVSGIEAVYSPPIGTEYEVSVGYGPAEMPSGLTFTDNGNGTATIAGTPLGPPTTAVFDIIASNGVLPSAKQRFVLTVESA